MIYKRTHGNVLLTHYDAHTGPETSVHLTKLTGITDTFQIATARGAKTATVSNGAQFAVGGKIKIKDIIDTNSEYDLITIKVIAGNVLTFDRPLDIAHSIGTQVIGVTQNMAVDGSVTPQTFFWEPREGQLTHVHSVHILFTCATEPSLQLYAVNPALTYGSHFRVIRPTEDRDITYGIPIRSLNSLLLSGFTYTKEEKVGGGDWYAHMAIKLIDDNNTIITLDQTKGEQFQCVIQDLTTGNISMEVKLSIHSEERFPS